MEISGGIFQVTYGRDPFNQNFRKFRSETQWIGLVQPESFEKKAPPFEVDHFSRSDRLEFLLNGSRPYSSLTVLDTVHVSNFVQSRYCRWRTEFFFTFVRSPFFFLRFLPFIKWFTIIFFGKVWVDSCSKPQFLKQSKVCLSSIDIVLCNSWCA